MRTIYIDVDEVILNSIEAVCGILNKKFNKDLHAKDIHTWNFLEYGDDITVDDVENAFASDEFFDTVEPNDSALLFITKEYQNMHDIVVVTKGREDNIEKKKRFIDKIFEEIHVPYEYIGIPLEVSKGSVDMSDGILIDDNEANLYESNAKYKVLCINNINSEWNSTWTHTSVKKDKIHCLNLKYL